MDFYNLALMYCWWGVNMIWNSPPFHFGNWRAMRCNHTSSSSMCLAPLPTSVNTISFGDTLRFSLPCNLFCLSIWWMSCLPALPHTLENASLRTLLKELRKRRRKASVFCKQFLLWARAWVCALKSCHVSHWIIKCERLIWEESECQSRNVIFPAFLHCGNALTHSEIPSVSGTNPVEGSSLTLFTAVTVVRPI